MKFENLKIKTRLLLGFGALVLMVLALGGLSVWHSGMIWSNTDFLYNHPFKTNMAVREMETKVMAIQRSMKNVVIAETQDELNEAVHHINLDESEVYRLFDTIYRVYLGRQSSVDTALSTFKDWKPIRDETIRLHQMGATQDAVVRTKTLVISGS